MPRIAVTTPVDALALRVERLGELLALLCPVPEEWLKSAPRAAVGGGDVLGTLECRDYATLVNAWREALRWTDGLDHALAVMLASCASVRGLDDQLWFKIIGPASCGKSELCEALSTAREYVLPVSTLRGFHSGYERPDGKDCNLISQLNGMTLVTKDGDTLLQAPNLPQILSEARDLYDGTARSHYRTGVGRSWEGVRFTWLLGGTSALRAIDSSELGERFLDCVIVERIDEDLEDEIQWHVVNRVIGHLGVETDGTPESRIGPELADARSLTGGYVEWLREHGTKLLGRVVIPRSVRLQVMRLAKFVALMRARPSARQDETAEREMAPRLTIQLTRLATYLPVVLNREEVDSVVMARVRRVALDTARGQTLALVSLMAGQGELGDVVASMALLTNKREEHTRSLLRFLREIGVCEPYQHRTTRGLTKTQIRWRLTRRMAALYREVMRDA